MIYKILRTFLTPIFYIIMMFGGKKGDFLKKRLVQDLSKLKDEEYIWVHCSSVGEINLSEVLIKKLLKNRKERILITLFTDTGIAVAKDKFKKEDRVDIFYFPLDDKKDIKKILSKIKLNYLILIETEIWPNLIELSSKVAKVVMVNGRISDKSFKRYLKVRFLLKDIFKNISAFYMQSSIDSERIIELGADAKKVETMGNLKFDIEFQKYSEEEKKELKEFLNIENKKVFTAGSSRTGEYEILIKVFSKLKDTKLILVPRHIERTPEIEKLVKDFGYNCIKYSEIKEKNQEKTDILIVDTIGMLRKIYSISDIAFVGGTLVNIGGHSLLEPLFYKKTPIFGPYLQNVKEISKDILANNLGHKVKNEEEFLNAIEVVEKNQDKSARLIEQLFDKNRGTADKIIAKLKKL